MRALIFPTSNRICLMLENPSMIKLSIIITHANIFASVVLKSAANIQNNNNSCKYFCVSWVNFIFFIAIYPKKHLRSMTSHRSLPNFGTKNRHLLFSVMKNQYYPMGSPQNSFLLQFLQCFPIQTSSNWFMACSTSSGLSVRMPASKLRVPSPFMPMPAPVRLALPI